MNRLKKFVAAILVLVWMPVASYCLVQACGLTHKGDCCPEEQSVPLSAPGACDKPCGVLASGTYFPEQDRIAVAAPVNALLLYTAALVEIHASDTIAFEVPATDPPEVALSWLFSSRAALPPRAPSRLS